MEVLLVLLMLLLVFRQTIFEWIEKNTPKAIAHAESLIKYLGASALLSLTLSCIPALFITIYMRVEGFFAYEIFSSENSGFSALTGNILVNFLVLSFAFFGTAVMFSAKVSWFLRVGLALLNALYITYFLLIGYTSNNWIVVLSTLLTTALITAYFSFWMANGIEGKSKFWALPLWVSVVLLLIPVMIPNFVAGLVSGALAQMKVGGIEVNITSSDDFLSGDKDQKKYWLLLRTPAAIYFKENVNSKVVTYFHSENYSVTPITKIIDKEKDKENIHYAPESGGDSVTILRSTRI